MARNPVEQIATNLLLILCGSGVKRWKNPGGFKLFRKYSLHCNHPQACIRQTTIKSGKRVVRQMTVLKVTLRQGRLTCDDGKRPLGSALADRLDALPKGAPLAILIHGFKYHPDLPSRSPHSSLFSDAPDPANWKVRSWTIGLGFETNDPNAGLAICLGWPARSPQHWGGFGTGFARAYDLATTAAEALSGMLEDIAALRPDLTIDIFAHSLGARVALIGAAHTPAARIGRMILLGGAEYSSVARDCLTSPAFCSAEVFNIISRENDLFDALFEWAAPGSVDGDTCLGAGLGHICPRWADVEIDAEHVTRYLFARGFPLAGSKRRISHWSFYTRPGALAIYRSILRDRLLWSASDLSTRFAEKPLSRRWSRLFSPLPRTDHVDAEALALLTRA